MWGNSIGAAFWPPYMRSMSMYGRRDLHCRSLSCASVVAKMANIKQTTNTDNFIVCVWVNGCFIEPHHSTMAIYWITRKGDDDVTLSIVILTSAGWNFRGRHHLGFGETTFLITKWSCITHSHWQMGHHLANIFPKWHFESAAVVNVIFEMPLACVFIPCVCQ